jgi:transcription elongation factor Elf1
MTMAKRTIDPDVKARDEDRVGNNAAFTCPRCGKVFIVSRQIHKEKGRGCPWCGQSRGHAPSGNEDENGAYIEWSGHDPF